MRRAFLAGLLGTLAVIAAAAAIAWPGGAGRDDPSPGPRPAAASAAGAAAGGARSNRRWPRHITTDYQMFSRAGNRAMRAVIRRAAKMLKAGASREEVMRAVAIRFRALEDLYSEAGDTAVRDAFGDELDRWLIAAGYEPTEASDEYS
jgi:hypothetical protein